MDYNEGFNSAKSILVYQEGKQATIDFTRIRGALGWTSFPAYHYNIHQKDNGDYYFIGNGYGHHVGMSQWGAFMMAKHYKKNYKDILHHYYLNVELTTLY